MKKVRLGDLATVITKGTTPTTLGYNFVDDGVNFVKIESITENGEFLTDKFAHITDECDRKLSRSQLQQNDLLFSIAGAIGRTAIVTEEILPANTNQALAIIRVPEGLVDYSYLKYVLQSPDIVEQFEKKKQGVAQLNISLKDIGDFVIPLCTEEEQKTVVSTLDKVSELVALRKEQLAKLDQLVKSRFIQLLQPYFDKGETQPLINFVCDNRPITYGILKPGTDYEGGHPVIRVKDFSRGLVSVKEVLHTTPEIYSKYLRSVLAEGDIIISIGGTIGRIAIIPKEFAGANITQHTARIALKDKRYLLYFRGLLESDMMQRWMKERVLGVAQPSINLGDVKQIPIPIVDECVIKELNTFVEQTDKSKLAIQQSLDKLELLKKSLMQEYFG